MDRKEILKQCCNEACIWNDQEACHQVSIFDKILLIDDLKFLSTIRVHDLYLWDNNIGDNGAKYLAENKTIHTLDLSGNKIGDNGAKYLAENKTIHTLGVYRNKIGDNGAKYFAEEIMVRNT